MKPHHHQAPPKGQDLSSLPFYDINTTISATECTGIAPADIRSPGEAEAVSALYDIHMPCPSRPQNEAEASAEEGLEISPDE